jgi:hypothetical protein
VIGAVCSASHTIEWIRAPVALPLSILQHYDGVEFLGWCLRHLLEDRNQERVE